MPKQIVAYKDKDGCLYESKEEAIKEEFGADLYNILEGAEEKYQVIDHIKDNPHALRKILDDHYPVKQQRKGK